MDKFFVVERLSSSEWAVVDSYGLPVRIFPSFSAAESYCFQLRSKFHAFVSRG